MVVLSSFKIIFSYFDVKMKFHFEELRRLTEAFVMCVMALKDLAFRRESVRMYGAS